MPFKQTADTIAIPEVLIGAKMAVVKGNRLLLQDPSRDGESCRPGVKSYKEREAPAGLTRGGSGRPRGAGPAEGTEPDEPGPVGGRLGRTPTRAGARGNRAVF